METEFESDRLLRKSAESCPNIPGCTLREQYYYKFGECKVHDLEAAKNCFIVRVREQINGILRNGHTPAGRLAVENHKFPINLAASYVVCTSQESDMAQRVKKWYLQQFENAGIPKHMIPKLKLLPRSELTATLSAACRAAIENQTKSLDDDLDRYFRRGKYAVN